MPAVKRISVELKKEKLDTLLDDLEKYEISYPQFQNEY